MNNHTPPLIKFHPKVKFELKELINDLSISLNDIDTSHIADKISLFKSTKRTDFSGIENWDVSNVTNMSGMFEGVKSFNQPLSSWDVSRVKNMSYMFANATKFNQDISNWNVSNVTDMSWMFAGAESFNQPLNKWNVSKVTKMYRMFYNAKSFNQSLDNWNISSSTDISGMMRGASKFFRELPKSLKNDLKRYNLIYESASSYEYKSFKEFLNSLK